MRTPSVQTVLCTALMLLAGTATGSALTPLSDQEMGAVQGRGIAIAFDDFQFAMAPTSFAEQVGVTPAGACTATSGAGNQNCWRRGDLRWFGGNISGAGIGGSHFTEAACNAGSLACPRGGNIENFAPFDNPYIVRAWSPQGIGFSGECINGADGFCSGAPIAKTIYEFLAPTTQPDFTFSFWGEIESGRAPNPADPFNLQAGTRHGLLKSQTIIRGNAAGSIFRAFQFTEPGNRTLGLLYHSRLQGDFRLSVNQVAGGATDVPGAVPLFDNEEGLHFRNVEAFIPFGQLFHQALIIGPQGTNGGFFIEVPKVSTAPEVFNRFYGLQSGDSLGFDTARQAVAGNTTAAYRESHGFSRWGDGFPTVSGVYLPGTQNGRADTDDGIFFRACEACAAFDAFAKRPTRIDVRGETESMQLTQNYVAGTGLGPGPITQGVGNGQVINTRVANLGDSRAEGILIQSFRLTTCSSGPGIC